MGNLRGDENALGRGGMSKLKGKKKKKKKKKKKEKKKN